MLTVRVGLFCSTDVRQGHKNKKNSPTQIHKRRTIRLYLILFTYFIMTIRFSIKYTYKAAKIILMFRYNILSIQKGYLCLFYCNCQLPSADMNHVCMNVLVS